MVYLLYSTVNGFNRKSREKAIVDAINYQIHVTQIVEVRGRWRYTRRLFPRLHTLFAKNV